MLYSRLVFIGSKLTRRRSQPVGRRWFDTFCSQRDRSVGLPRFRQPQRQRRRVDAVRRVSLIQLLKVLGVLSLSMSSGCRQAKDLVEVTGTVTWNGKPIP